jgi:hypothetical protein
LSVPFHPVLAPKQEESKCPQLGAFVKDALDQAKAFAGTEIPSFSLKSTKKSPGSAADVQVLTKTREAEGGKKQFWVARRSVHAGQKETGDASWDEFESGLRINHSDNEMAYTPNVKEATEVCRWTEIGDVEGWKKIEMAGTHPVPNRTGPCIETNRRRLKVYEMVHRLPPPLKPRIFTIPINLSPSRDEEKISASKYAASSAAVQGSYVSIEHVYMSPEGDILWAMATASDAKGNLPMAVQKLGVPGAIVKDVGLFLGWVERQRQAPVE